MGGGPSSSSSSSSATTSSSNGVPSELYKQAREDFDSRYATPAVFQLVYRDFQLLRPLGRGAFGSVKEVKCLRDPLPDFLQSSTLIVDSSTNASKCLRIALKIINKKSAHKMKQEEHVVNEKRILQSLNFPFIIHFYFSFKDNANLYIGLELIEGGELFRHLRDCEKFDEKKAKFYAAQIILALEYLHLLGIVYRDLKVNRIRTANMFIAMLISSSQRIYLSIDMVTLKCVISVGIRTIHVDH
jgi:protein kinase A